jgi:hypothetical protein
MNIKMGKKLSLSGATASLELVATNQIQDPFASFTQVS